MEEILLQIINNKDYEMLNHILEEHFPVDIALGLETLNDETVLNQFLEMAKNDLLSEVLRESEPTLQRTMIQNLSFQRATELFNLMPNDDVVDILGSLQVDLRKQYLSLMKNDNREDLQMMLSYDAHSAGGLMTTEFITIPQDLTVSQTLEKLREISPNTEVIDTLFITDKTSSLVGWIDIRDLFIHDSQAFLNDFMNHQVVAVQPETDQEEVAQLFAKYDLSMVPVVNHRQVILGIITVDDIIDVLQEEYQEDMLRMGGVQETEAIGAPFVDSLRKRLPWLLVNLATAFIVSATVAAFDHVIVQVVALAAISPFITGISGNSAEQTLALVIQGIALGKLNLKDDKKLVLGEIKVAAVNGLLTGLVAATAMFLFYQNFYLSLVVVLSMMINLCIGALFGFFVPLILKALKQDPALASSIFIHTATDTFGYFAFLGLAQVFLPLIL
jgi:magnesium transporter